MATQYIIRISTVLCHLMKVEELPYAIGFCVKCQTEQLHLPLCTRLIFTTQLLLHVEHAILIALDCYHNTVQSIHVACPMLSHMLKCSCVASTAHLSQYVSPVL